MIVDFSGISRSGVQSVEHGKAVADLLPSATPPCRDYDWKNRGARVQTGADQLTLSARIE